jgi:KTSC domain
MSKRCEDFRIKTLLPLWRGKAARQGRFLTRSSFIRRLCYDRRNGYMLISLNGTFYHYCEIDAGTVSSLLSAPSG